MIVKEQGTFSSKIPTSSRLSMPVRRAIAAAHGVKPLLYPVGFGSLPGYSFSGILGIPAFVVNHAHANSANHAPDENMTLECFHKGIRVGARFSTSSGRRRFTDLRQSFRY